MSASSSACSSSVSVTSSWGVASSAADVTDIRQLQSVDAATLEEATSSSMLINKALVELYIDAKPQAAYFQLFRRVDRMRCGAMRYNEFFDMVRSGLRIGKARLTDHELQAAWRWMDGGASGRAMGRASTASFLKFMRLGIVAFIERQQKKQMRQRPGWQSQRHLGKEPPWHSPSSADVGEKAEVRTDEGGRVPFGWSEGEAGWHRASHAERRSAARDKHRWTSALRTPPWEELSTTLAERAAER
jgi:hypothetical protein